jgi:hypothetical protein
MKLKLVVASMSVLGLISSPVFADTQSTSSSSTTTTTTKKLHHHHHYKKAQHKTTHHHHVAQSHEDYKAMGALPQPVVLPVVDTHQIMYNAMSQNTGRATQAMPDWFNRIGVTGGVNFDAHWGNRSQGYEGENVQRLSLNDAYLNIGANVNDWTKAFTSFSFSNPSARLSGSFFPLGTSGTPLAGQYSNVYTPVNGINLEQGYVTIANYDVSPIFFQIGKQYTDYGRYTIHPLVRTMTQVMTESLVTSAKLGFITQMGFHGDIYAFDNPATQTSQGHTGTIYGAALGFDQLNDQLGFDVGVGYMSNITGVNDINAALGNAYANGLTSTAAAALGFPTTGSYIHTVGGIAVYGDVNSGPFSLGVRYTQAIQHFNPNDISNQYNLAAGVSGARPWALDVTGGFGFNYWAKNQNLYLGYQTSNNAVNLALPKNRWIVGYNVDMWKNTNVGLEYNHDTSYSSGNNAFNHSSNTVGARASVKFG